MEKMKVKTLIKSLEPYKEADIYFFSIPNGEGFYKGCEIETDNKILLVYPKEQENNYKKLEILN